mmetsp:Transcript_74204/g.154758  ORF Transcript_74204/g.154758 Transcript_74204/m.154758 type:complete len:100 (+) Transcript_74204:175-474(+)
MVEGSNNSSLQQQQQQHHNSNNKHGRNRRTKNDDKASKAKKEGALPPLKNSRVWHGVSWRGVVAWGEGLNPRLMETTLRVEDNADVHDATARPDNGRGL